MRFSKSLMQGGLLFARLIFCLIVVATSALVMLRFIQVGMGNNDRATPRRMLLGNAHRPFVYRQLLPMAANLAAPLLDRGMALKFGKRLEIIEGERFFRGRLDGHGFPSEVLLILAMMYLSLLGMVVTVHLLLRDLGYGPIVQHLLPLALLPTISLTFNGNGYMYDFPAVFLFTLGLLLMRRESWIAYLVVLGLATLNKETAVFLLLVFAVFFRHRMPRPRFLMLLAVQSLVYVAIQGLLRYRYGNNNGADLEWHFFDHIVRFKEIGMRSPWQLVAATLALAGIAAMIAWKWPLKPRFLRSAMSIFPFFVVLFFLWGFPLEIRVFLEVIPIMAILVLPAPEVQVPIAHDSRHQGAGAIGETAGDHSSSESR